MRLLPICINSYTIILAYSYFFSNIVKIAWSILSPYSGHGRKRPPDARSRAFRRHPIRDNKDEFALFNHVFFK